MNNMQRSMWLRVIALQNSRSMALQDPDIKRFLVGLRAGLEYAIVDESGDKLLENFMEDAERAAGL